MKKNLLLAMLAFLLVGVTMAQTSLMSYNIKYANETDGGNSWSQRKDFLLNQLKFYEPDILGVQEALISQMQYLDENLESYQYIGIGRDGGTKGEFSAIFYNSEKMEVLTQDTFWLSETPDTISRGWDAALNRICTYAQFRDKKTGDKFWVFNTHFDHRGQKARSESAHLILEKIKELNTEVLPLFLMGDFNLEPTSESIREIAKVLNDSRAVASAVVFGPVGTFNAYQFNEAVTKRIDYIFTSPKRVKVLKYAVLSDSRQLKYPSDHLPVFVKVNILPQEPQQ